MKFTQIRNATIHIEYAGKKFLIDPVLAAKGTYPGFAGTMNSHQRNPLVELPMSIEKVIDVDAVIVTHTHPDHWDEAAIRHIPKDMLIFVQNEQDRDTIEAAGFTSIRLMTEHTYFHTITIIKTQGQHGSDEAIRQRDTLGKVCGVVFRNPEEKTLYVAGDTIWNIYVADTLRSYRPEVIILNCGDAQVLGLGHIIMNKQDVLCVCQAAPEATVIASHMEAVNHAMLSRKELRRFLAEKTMGEQVLIPEDGQSYQL